MTTKTGSELECHKCRLAHIFNIKLGRHAILRSDTCQQSAKAADRRDVRGVVSNQRVLAACGQGEEVRLEGLRHSERLGIR